MDSHGGKINSLYESLMSDVSATVFIIKTSEQLNEKEIKIEFDKGNNSGVEIEVIPDENLIDSDTLNVLNTLDNLNDRLIENVPITPHVSHVSNPNYADSPIARKIKELKSAASQDKLNRFAGLIFGAAIGEVAGIPYKNHQNLNVNQNANQDQNADLIAFAKDATRGIMPGDWSCNTNSIILLMQSFVFNNMKFAPRDFCQRMIYWREKGMTDLSSPCVGIGPLHSFLLKDEAYLDRPLESAKRAFLHVRQLGNTEMLIRSALLCVFTNWRELCVKFCLLSSTDIRCVFSCWIITYTCRCLFLSQNPSKDYINAEMDNFLKKKVYRDEFAVAMKIINHKWVSQIDEDLPNCYKTIIAMFETIERVLDCNGSLFVKKLLSDAAKKGGDSEVNTAITGIIVGLKLGFNSLPEDWLRKLNHRIFLEKLTLTFWDLGTP